ncbi:rhoptry kinase family protein rop11 (incomplete catalytic triad) [Cystoisospora suis]|uniref:Rhoptry kinase family protein rop11 (Incomplete catalytic triad) n=1 Tax=Cystoisospora suis TaxID=483139 RepID=A0A2C6KI62_9APIC|nr:rhoptry kinase family protein rop11 (incomplete catalytic triad) [Cystoisospora suis]
MVVSASFTSSTLWGNIFCFGSLRYLNRGRLCCSVWIACFLASLVLTFSHVNSSHKTHLGENETSPFFFFAKGYDLKTKASSHQLISKHGSPESSSPETPIDEASSYFSPSIPYSTLEASPPVIEEGAAGKEEEGPSLRSVSSVRSEAYPRPRHFSSGSSPHSFLSSRPSSPVTLPLSLPDWMTSDDQLGKKVLGEQCQLLQRSDVVAYGSSSLLGMIDEAIPEHLHMKIRILSSDIPNKKVSGGPPRLQGAAAGGVGERDDDGHFIIVQRGRVLGTGGEAVVVQGDLVEPRSFSSTSLMRGEADVSGESEETVGEESQARQGRKKERTKERRLSASSISPLRGRKSDRQTRETREGGENDEEEPERGQSNEERRRGESSRSGTSTLPRRSMREVSARGTSPYEKTIYRPVALRFAVTGRLKPEMLEGTSLPYTSDRQIEAYIAKVNEEQERLVSLTRKHGGSDVMKNTFNLVLPSIVGRLEGYAPKLSEIGRGLAKRLLVNSVTVSPFMNGSLGMMLGNSNLLPSSLVYVAKSLIRIAANLDLLDLVHRDIKLGNLLVGEVGEVYLTDFQYVKEKSQSFACREVVSVYLTEPSLAMCWLKSGSKQIHAHHSHDAWMTGMAVFMWLCDEFPFDGMTYDHMGERSNARTNVYAIARMHDPSISSDENRQKKFPAPINWERCRRFPLIHEYPHLKDAIEGLLDINPFTRSRPYQMIATHPLFRTETAAAGMTT